MRNPRGLFSSAWAGALVGLVVLFVTPVHAQEYEKLRETLKSVLPGGQIDAIQPTPVKGVVEVQYSGRIFYFTEDGAHFFRGDLIDVAARSNLTENTRRGQRLRTLEKMGESSMVVYSPEKPQHTITVFTDVDCPYCARFHNEVPQLNELGVKVRYAAFPRQGIPSANYDRMVSVWCAGDPLQAMTDAKAGKSIAKATCENKVKEHFDKGQALGVGGTPTIILDSGDLVGGYVPYKQLVLMLQGH